MNTSSSMRSAFKRVLGIRSWNSDEDQQFYLRNVQTIFDVGANVGQTAKTYRGLFPQATIWSFEPFPSCFAKLRGALPDARFNPVEIALSDTVGTAKLNVGAESITNSLLHRATESGSTVEVVTDTVDHFCEQRGIDLIDILKVDVEGAESRVFRGATEMLRSGRVRAVFVEVYFDPVYEGMPLMWDLHHQLKALGLELRGLYSLYAGKSGRLSFGNALYLRPQEFIR